MNFKKLKNNQGAESKGKPNQKSEYEQLLVEYEQLVDDPKAQIFKEQFAKLNEEKSLAGENTDEGKRIDAQMIELAKNEHKRKEEARLKYTYAGQKEFEKKMREAKKNMNSTPNGSLEKEAWEALMAKLARDDHAQKIKDSIT